MAAREDIDCSFNMTRAANFIPTNLTKTVDEGAEYSKLYLRDHIAQMRLAITDGCEVMGYSL